MYDQSLKLVYVAVLALTLAGCGWVSDPNPLRSIEEQLGVPVVEAGSVQVGSRVITFFRFQKGNQCGTGHVTRGTGGSGWGQGTCGNAPIVPPSSGSASLPEGGALFTISGQVNDPDVSKVTITLSDGSQIPARVSQGTYFAAFVGQGVPGSLQVVRVQGFGKAGDEVHQIEIGTKRP